MFGLYDIHDDGESTNIEALMTLILDLRNELKNNKDWVTADKIRNGLIDLNIEIKDVKDGTNWNYKK